MASATTARDTSKTAPTHYLTTLSFTMLKKHRVKPLLGTHFMGIRDFISGISDFIDIFRPSYDSGDSYDRAREILSSSTKLRPKLKKNPSATSKKQYTPPVKKEQSLQPLWQNTENYDRKACQLIVQCLKEVKLDLAESAVRKLREQYPYKTERELARILIVKKSFVLGKVTLDQTDPGALSDQNAKEILKGMENVQLPRLIRFSAEMIYQIALIYGLPLRYDNWEVEILSVFYAALLGDEAIKHGLNWLKFGTSKQESISCEMKTLMVYALGETACLFFEKIYEQGFNPFKNNKDFNEISKQAQKYIKPFYSEATVKKMVSVEIEKAFPIEYHKLCDLLEAKLWKKADLETFDILLKLIRRKEVKLCEEVLLMANENNSPRVWISKINSEDLEILNNVWMQNSDGHFGFAIQSQIYMQTQSLEDFYQTVGWTNDVELKSYDQLTFNLDSPQGHLPGFWLHPDFPFSPNNTIVDWLPVFLHYVRNISGKVAQMDEAESTIVNSSEESPNVNSDDKKIDIESND